MKKIININLSGRVIPIEDSAYEKLQGYIESLRRYFSKEEGRDEIINDIESRIAELMEDKIRKGATAVTDADIDAIAASMGRPDDLDAELNEETSGSEKSSEPNFTYGNTRAKRRLYRNTNDKLLGGVCSGIANYLDIDPAIIRLLFAIITLGGFGFGVLAYIILWIVLPEQGLGGYSGKRLYRNPDDRVLGGVASGLAAYFNKDTKTIRLIFSIPLILILLKVLIGIFSAPFLHFGYVFPIAFGSLTGTFILAYIILWIVLPEANTEYQKMEMRGETIDVNRIKQNVQDKAREFGEEVKSAAHNFSQRIGGYSKDKSKKFAQEVSQAAGRAGTGFGHVIGVIFKVFFFFIAGSIAFALFVGLLALLFSGVAWWPVNNFLWTSDWQKLFAWGTIIFFLLVPLVGFITWLVRRIMRVRSGSGYMGWTFGALWFLGWVCVIFLAASIARDFRYYEETKNEISIEQPAGKITLGVTDPELTFNGGYGWMSDEPNGWNITDDTLRLSWVNIDVKLSTDSNYHVILWKNSWGKNDEDAIRRAEGINYDIAYASNYLNLGNGYAVGKEDKFRGQHVVLEVQVPAGKKIRFDRTITEKLNNVDVEVYDSYGRRRNWNRRGVHIRDYDFRWSTNTDYVMGEDGVLFNPDRPNEVKPKDGYRYNDNKSRKEELKEELKKLEEQEKKDSMNKQSAAKQESMEDLKESVSFDTYTSPIFSVARFFN
ncbi:MAG: PspC domain-containing protein [Terrimonas sp.]|nr:PspC domain-containing protein [Terrimonas sp.]